MKIIFTMVLVCLSVSVVSAMPGGDDPLVYRFDGRYGQVEVGGPFVGVEFHHSRPLPSRISFYEPAANSIDLSTDYWKRDASRPMAVGIQVGDGTKQWIGREGWTYALSPHTVLFTKSDSVLSYAMRYEFCQGQPAMVWTFTVKNDTKKTQAVTVYTHLLLALRTCQTYLRRDSSVVSIDSLAGTIQSSFPYPDTRNASVFVINTGQRPLHGWCTADALSANDDGNSRWIDMPSEQLETTPAVPDPVRGIAAFEYVAQIPSGDSMTVVQVIGSTGTQDIPGTVAALRTGWKREVQAYATMVKEAAGGSTQFETGNAVLDRSIHWSKALLATNAHSIDGTVVPMPCPAEYNFFFTHDLLMTDLGAVNYDTRRVKENLLYVASHTKDSIIPHAYYWRDDGYKTELCTPSNWNHLWFIEVSAGYLRHTLDTTTVRRLWPYISKSLSEVLTQLHDDHLMYAYRPDWWDIGWKEGPRAYITALTIRAVEEYLFMASFIAPSDPTLSRLESESIAMRSALASRLWDDSLQYLINYNGTDKDEHLYMGSLIAPAYGVVSPEKSRLLLATAERRLLTPKVGIRAAMPADFDSDSLIRYFKFVGDEAGKPFYYINGGVWPHNNAWYAIALNAAGQSEKALSFVKDMMTIDGIANSPNGIPAMYEYRMSDESSALYGTIDKPSFLWAGGFYLFTMYSLAGFSDNAWNLSFGGNHPDVLNPIQCSYSFGTMHTVNLSGKGERIRSTSVNGRPEPSRVLSLDALQKQTISVMYGTVTTPYVDAINAVLHSAELGRKGKELRCSVSSFPGHHTRLQVIAPSRPSRVTCDGVTINGTVDEHHSDGSVTVSADFVAGSGISKLIFTWK